MKDFKTITEREILIMACKNLERIYWGPQHMSKEEKEKLKKQINEIKERLLEIEKEN